MRTATRMVVLGRNLWTPAALGSSLALWLDADDFSTITLNGSTVSQWRDKSGNGRHASQANPANQPIYTLNGQGGLAVIVFDGLNDVLQTAASFSLGETVVTVARRTHVNQCVVEADGEPYYRGLWGDNYPRYSSHLNYGVNGGQLSTTLPLSAVGATAIVAQTGNQVGARSWRLGAGFPSNAPLNGFIPEMVATSALLSTIDLQYLVGYLAHKWGLTADLPINHLFKFTPPYI